MTRVLLAEDDVAISEPLARALRREGYEVVVREDGPSALEAGLAACTATGAVDTGTVGIAGCSFRVSEQCYVRRCAVCAYRGARESMAIPLPSANYFGESKVEQKNLLR